MLIVVKNNVNVSFIVDSFLFIKRKKKGVSFAPFCLRGWRDDIMKPKHIEYKFLPFCFWFLLKGEQRTRDLQSRCAKISVGRLSTAFTTSRKRLHKGSVYCIPEILYYIVWYILYIHVIVSTPYRCDHQLHTTRINNNYWEKSMKKSPATSFVCSDLSLNVIFLSIVQLSSVAHIRRHTEFTCKHVSVTDSD